MMKCCRFCAAKSRRRSCIADKVRDREKHKNYLQKLCEISAEKVSAEENNLEEDNPPEVSFEGKDGAKVCLRKNDYA